MWQEGTHLNRHCKLRQSFGLRPPPLQFSSNVENNDHLCQIAVTCISFWIMWNFHPSSDNLHPRSNAISFPCTWLYVSTCLTRQLDKWMSYLFILLFIKRVCFCGCVCRCEADICCVWPIYVLYIYVHIHWNGNIKLSKLFRNVSLT